MFKWKKTVMFGAISVLTCFGWSVIFAGGSLVDDNFNNYKAGDKPEGYIFQETSGKVLVTELPNASDKSLFLDDQGGDNIKVTKKFAFQSGVVTAELSFMQPSLGNTAKILRLLEAETGNIAVHLETKSGMLSYKKADGTFISMAAYEEKAWTKVTVIADVKAQTATIYINGELKAARAPFFANVKSISAFDSYTPGSSAKGHYLDNIKITEGAVFKLEQAKPAAQTSAPITGNASKAQGLITDLGVKDPATAKFWSVQPNIQSGDNQFGDRAFVITNLPASLAGYQWIQTASDSKSFSGDVLATFKVSKEADVYVAFDTRVSIKPEWLDSWTETKEYFSNTDPNIPRFNLYHKHVAANSTITLGPNGQRVGCFHYTVIVKGVDKPAVASNTKPAAVIPATWKGILGMRSDWFKSAEAIRIADNVLLFQRNSGGWYKYRDHSADNYDIAIEFSAAEKEQYLKDKALNDATIDNGATYTHLRYLAKVYTATRLERFKDGFYKGLDFLLQAQYPNGGWPQYYPDKTVLYRAHITYNDEAMINVLKLIRDITQKQNPEFKFIDGTRRKRAKKALGKGIDCILKTQVRVNGKLTVWCAQHDEVTLAPAAARAYELESLSGSESLGIIRFLMSINRPSAAIKTAVQSAVAWLNEVKLTGIQVVEEQDANKPKGFDKVIVKNSHAPMLWARFYEIGTNLPFFCGRDGVKKYQLSEIEYERRIGYSWYTGAPSAVLAKEYPEWQAKWDAKHNVLKK